MSFVRLPYPRIFVQPSALGFPDLSATRPGIDCVIWTLITHLDFRVVEFFFPALALLRVLSINLRFVSAPFIVRFPNSVVTSVGWFFW